MQNPNTPAHDSQTLEAVAEILLWLGFDRVADAIYADLGCDNTGDYDRTAGTWGEAFDS